jgi:pilus assembly protein CpaB
MPNVLKIGLLIVVAGVVALVMRGLYVSASTASASVPSTEKIRVAASDLPEGLLLRDSDLEWKEVPRGNVIAGAFAADTPAADQIKGALLRHAMPKGTPIMSTDVILANDPGFLSATLKPDMRAISVGIDPVSGNAGLIQPGDYVDLLLTQEMNRQSESPDRSVSSETVVQHVRVLAVGSELQRQKSGTDNRTARTVTLETTPRKAEMIAVASKLGTLSLALRSFATTHNSAAITDQDTETDAPVWAGDISKASRMASKPAPTPHLEVPRALLPTPSVMVFRGSKSGEENASVVGSGGAGNPPLPTLPGLPGLPATPVGLAQIRVPQPQ